MVKRITGIETAFALAVTMIPSIAFASDSICKIDIYGGVLSYVVNEDDTVTVTGFEHNYGNKLVLPRVIEGHRVT